MKEFKQEKPKLLFLITKSNWGGAQKYVYDLATSQAIRKKFNIKVASGNDGELLARLNEKHVETDVLALKNKANPFEAFFEFRRLVQFLKKERPTIVHINSSKMGLLGVLAARMTKVPHVVFTSHGWPFNEKRPFVQRAMFRTLMWITVYASDYAIAVSEQTKKSLRAPKWISKKMRIIYLGIQSEAPTVLPKLSQGSTTKHIISIGELNANKGHDTVLSILPYVENVHYHIIGEGVLRQKLEKIIENKGLSKSVTLYGHIPNASKLLPQYDVFLLPSRTEALGYVALEALQAGLPVIAREVGGVPEILRGLPYARLYKDDSELISILKEELPPAEGWTDERFSHEGLIKKTLFTYQELLDGSHRSKN